MMFNVCGVERWRMIALRWETIAVDNYSGIWWQDEEEIPIPFKFTRKTKAENALLFKFKFNHFCSATRTDFLLFHFVSFLTMRFVIVLLLIIYGIWCLYQFNCFIMLRLWLKIKKISIITIIFLLFIFLFTFRPTFLRCCCYYYDFMIYYLIKFQLKSINQKKKVLFMDYLVYIV